MSFSVRIEWYKIADALILLLGSVYAIASLLFILVVLFELSSPATELYLLLAGSPLLFNACATIVSHARNQFPPNKQPLINLIQKAVPVYFFLSPVFSGCAWLTTGIESKAVVAGLFFTMLFLHTIPFLLLHCCTVEKEEITQSASDPSSAISFPFTPVPLASESDVSGSI